MTQKISALRLSYPEGIGPGLVAIVKVPIALSLKRSNKDPDWLTDNDEFII